MQEFPVSPWCPSGGRSGKRPSTGTPTRTGFGLIEEPGRQLARQRLRPPEAEEAGKLPLAARSQDRASNSPDNTGERPTDPALALPVTKAVVQVAPARAPSPQAHSHGPRLGSLHPAVRAR